MAVMETLQYHLIQENASRVFSTPLQGHTCKYDSQPCEGLQPVYPCVNVLLRSSAVTSSWDFSSSFLLVHTNVCVEEHNICFSVFLDFCFLSLRRTIQGHPSTAF